MGSTGDDGSFLRRALSLLIEEGFGSHARVPIISVFGCERILAGMMDGYLLAVKHGLPTLRCDANNDTKVIQ